VDDDSNEIEALDVQFIRPEALGEPGSRRFRIVVVIEGRTVVAWMEKDQVRRLAELLLDIVRRLPNAPQAEPVSPGDVVPNAETSDQFRVGRMELSFDEEDNRLIVIMHDLESDDDAPPALAFRLSRGQSTTFSDEADELVNAGRPPCPLCGRPMGPGPHVCEKQNGHLVH
jgi:uncharacterized repeat protein (TIGR03847 family)